ncbi:MAG: arginase family protein, partial [Bacteroidia bacterium]
MKYYNEKKNFLAIPGKGFYSYEASRFIIQQAPYERTSSYISGSEKGPQAMVSASQFVELYDEELQQESYKNGGICTLHPIEFGKKKDAKAMNLIAESTKRILDDKKFPVTLGAEHTITLGTVQAIKEKYPDVCVLQFDAHSDLRESYNGNPYSHASVMH